MAKTYNGLLLVNKPAGISSYDVIRQLKRILLEDPELPLNHRGKKILPKIGHAGTLDPAATGLMLILLGTGTKQAMKLTKLDKTYLSEITLGRTSSTGDRDGEISFVSDTIPSEKEVQAAVAKFTGEISQTPSIYSAIKIDGKEAYKRARAGERIEMPSRQIKIYSSKLLTYAYPRLTLRVRVSSGTYIRSLAEDIGAELGSGGYLTLLTRETVGKYLLSDAIILDNATFEQINAYLSTI